MVVRFWVACVYMFCLCASCLDAFCLLFSLPPARLFYPVLNCSNYFSHPSVAPAHDSKNEEKSAHPAREQQVLSLIGDNMGSGGGGEGCDTFRGKLCHDVQTKLTLDTSKWGIEIVEFAISDIGFQNIDVENKLAEATAKTRQAESNFDLQRAENAANFERARGIASTKLVDEENQ